MREQISAAVAQADDTGLVDHAGVLSTLIRDAHSPIAFKAVIGPAHQAGTARAKTVRPKVRHYC